MGQNIHLKQPKPALRLKVDAVCNRALDFVLDCPEDEQGELLLAVVTMLGAHAVLAAREPMDETVEALAAAMLKTATAAS